MNYVTKKEFAELERRVKKLEGSRSLKKIVNKKKSIRDFILEKKWRGTMDKTMCLMYYLEEATENFKEGVSSKDLTKAFKDAREIPPGNISDVLGKCAKKGWTIISRREKTLNKWKLTNAGLQHVEKLEED